MKQWELVNLQCGLIAAYMAIVLSDQENIDLLLWLVKVAIALGGMAIVLWFLFWLRLKNLEKRLYVGRKQLHSQFSVRTPQKTYAQKIQRTLVTTKVAHRPSTNIKTNVPTSRKFAPVPQVYRPATYVKTLKKSPKRTANANWIWLLAIALASITGTAIALLQLGNNWISPEFTTLLWFGIGVMIILSATLVEIT